MDPDKGILIRCGEAARLNPYDYYAVEAALRIREMAAGGIVTAFTMGPDTARAVLREAYGMGVDEGVLISDPAFAGADVLATSHTLAQAIKTKGAFDLILCGRQTTDGDTAQVGPSIGAHLDIPYASWVTGIESVEKNGIIFIQQLTNVQYRIKLPFPCLLAVETGIYQPRLPSIRLKLQAQKKSYDVMRLDSMPDADAAQYGQKGSPTRVRRIFRPAQEVKGEPLTGDSEVISHILAEMLAELVKP